MDLVRREPVDLRHDEMHAIERMRAHVGECHLVGIVALRLAHAADQSYSLVAVQREHGNEVEAIEVSVKLACVYYTRDFDIGNVEELCVRAARKTDAECFAHPRTRAIAAGNVCRVALRLGAIGRLERRTNAVCGRDESEQLRGALDVHTQRVQMLNEQTLVLVLREGQQVGKRAQSLAQDSELNMSSTRTA